MSNKVSKKILIVEDDDDQRNMLKVVLEQEGYRVITAQGARNALVYAELGPPDLILLDIMLASHMDGLEVLARLKTAKSTAQVPVMVMSALSDETQIKRAREAGAVDYLVKPYQITDLITRVESALIPACR
jgi:DNA-binding response OmpR family regulator